MRIEENSSSVRHYALVSREFKETRVKVAIKLIKNGRKVQRHILQNQFSFDSLKVNIY